MSLSLVKLSTVIQRCLRTFPSSMVSSLPNICVHSQARPSIFSCLVTRNYAVDSGGTLKKKGKGLTVTGKIKEFPVETDPHKLVTHCCGLNYFQTGEEVKLKPDSEYPDWIYTEYIGKTRRSTQLDPNTKEYWECARIEARKRDHQLRKLRRKLRIFK